MQATLQQSPPISTLVCIRRSTQPISGSVNNMLKQLMHVIWYPRLVTRYGPLPWSPYSVLLHAKWWTEDGSTFPFSSSLTSVPTLGCSHVPFVLWSPSSLPLPLDSFYIYILCPTSHKPSVYMLGWASSENTFLEPPIISWSLQAFIDAFIVLPACPALKMFSLLFHSTWTCLLRI